jgi:FAD/FMN-containing dehydrogenase
VRGTQRGPTRRAVDVDPAAWAALDQRVGGRLLRVDSPLRPCFDDPASPACSAVLRDLTNPFRIQAEPGAFQTTGWLGAYVAEPSAYAVAARSADDVAAAVLFARDHDIRLVVKGTGHDYLGRSSDGDALLVWTHPMREIVVHDAFMPTGATASGSPVPAMSVGAGARWLEAYHAAEASGRFVLGGGCTSVGVAGFTLGGGFGSFSRRFGTAAGNVLELEVVTADGDVLVANEAQHADLFWALRGGGGGTFGIVTRLTMRTHEPPSTVGAVFGTITAHNDAAYRRLVHELLAFLAEHLANEHWGEQVRLGPDNGVQVTMTFLDLETEVARATWRPLIDWLERHPDEFTIALDVAAQPFGTFWDGDWWERTVPGFVKRDHRPDSPGLFWWSTNQDEVSQYIDAYASRWLPKALMERSAVGLLGDAVFEASRHWQLSLHANKGLSGAADDALARDRRTAIHAAAFDAAALVIVASEQEHRHPGVRGHEPDEVAGAENVQKVRAAIDRIRAVTPGAGAYVNEADYFEPGWQESFWGANYGRLAEIKRRYDPDNRFRVHHGAGSEG